MARAINTGNNPIKDNRRVTNAVSLLSSTSRVEIPFIKVTFGELDSGYTFGVYQKVSGTQNAQGVYSSAKIIYPNYVKSLSVDKINGQVNQYSLNLVYPIRPGDDPNFFEKVFGSVSKSRKIIFSYGDLAIPDYIYKNEQAIITDIRSSFDFKSSVINYSISAVSSAALGYSGSFSFAGGEFKPSDKIIELLTIPSYGLTDIFYGLRGLDESQLRKYIFPKSGSNDNNIGDKVVKIESKENIAILDYLKYLIYCMVPESSPTNNNSSNDTYALTIHDDVIGEMSDDEKLEKLGGPYFEITKLSPNATEYSEAYEMTLGLPSKDIILNFSVSDNETYSIYYDWQKKINEQDFVLRLDDNGEWYEEYAPIISSKNENHRTTSYDKVWWTRVTQYPISATITIKGLLRPATLMQYVHLEVLFYGWKHISSGTYIVTKQTDSVDANGYRTTLQLTRVAGDQEEGYVA